MKKLIVSLKTPSEALSSFRKAYKAASKGKIQSAHYEVCFDNKKDFNKFLKNIDIIIAIQNLKPNSIYDLAKLIGKDQSNLNKVILFFEQWGVLKIKNTKRNNRTNRVPVVDYQSIEFNLKAA